MSAKDDYTKKLEESILRVEAEKEAIRQEFQQETKNDKEFDTESVKKARDLLIPDALVTMKELLAIGESEGLRWNIAKFIITSKLTDKLDEGEDAFKQLLDELTAKSKAKAD